MAQGAVLAQALVRRPRHVVKQRFQAVQPGPLRQPRADAHPKLTVGEVGGEWTVMGEGEGKGKSVCVCVCVCVRA